MATQIRVQGRTDPLAIYTHEVVSPVAANRVHLALAESELAGSGPQVHDAIQRVIAAEHEALIQLSQELYDDPEIGFEEYRTVQRIAAFLAERGVEVEVGAFGLETAFTVTRGAQTGPHFAVLAEYDALPGVGHGCGHNLIAAVAVGAFLALNEVISSTGGRVSLIGTPAEENGGGKALIIEAGGFDDVDAAGMVHPSAGDGVSPVAGVTTSGVRRVAVTYRGRAAHAAAAPHLGLNALDAVVLGYQGVAALRQHIASNERVHGIITDGGAAPNVVPDLAAALYYVRSNTVERLRVLTDRVVDVLEGAALATGTTMELTLDPVPPYLPLRENVALSRRWADALTSRSADPLPPGDHQERPASTDMGNVSELIPALHPLIGIGAPPHVPPHHPEFARYTTLPKAHESIAEAAVALASAAADWLADPELRERAQQEFDQRGPATRWE